MKCVLLTIFVGGANADTSLFSAGPQPQPVQQIIRIEPVTLEMCTANLIVPKSTSIFYAGGPDYWKRTKQVIENRSYLKGYAILGDKWVDPNWHLKWQGDAHQAQFWDTCSKALAMATSGTAYVVLPPGKGLDWRKGTVWDRMEWPNIPKSVKVIRINPENEDMEVIQNPEKPIEVHFQMSGSIKLRGGAV